METDQEPKEQVLRVAGAVPAVGVPGFHHWTCVSAVERHGAPLVRRCSGSNVPETRGRVYYGHCRTQTGYQALARQRVPEQTDTIYCLQHPTWHQHTHGQIQ